MPLEFSGVEVLLSRFVDFRLGSVNGLQIKPRLICTSLGHRFSANSNLCNSEQYMYMGMCYFQKHTDFPSLNCLNSTAAAWAAMAIVSPLAVYHSCKSITQVSAKNCNVEKNLFFHFKIPVKYIKPHSTLYRI